MVPVLYSFWRFFKGVFLTSACLTFCLLLSFELRGVPDSLILGFQQNLAQQGLNLTIKEMHAGLINGVALKGVDVLDPDTGEHRLIHAESIHLDADRDQLLNGKVRLESLEVKDASLHLILKTSTQQRKLNFVRVNFKGQRSASKIDVEKLNCSWKNVSLELNGEIHELGNSIQDSGSSLDYDLLSLKYFNEGFTDELKNKIISFIDEFERLKISKTIKAKLDFQIFSQNPHKNKFSLFLEIPVFDYKKMTMAGSLTVDFNDQGIQLHDIQWKINNSEFLQGNLNVDIPKNRISGKISGRSHLVRLVNSFYPAFESMGVYSTDTPTSFSLHLTDSPLDDPYNWRLTGKVSLVDCFYRKLKFNNLTADFNYFQRKFDAKKVKFSTPRLQGDAELSYDIDESQLKIKGAFMGSPEEIHHFLKSDKVEGYKSIWQDFIWEESAMPHFNGEVIVSKMNSSQPEVKVRAGVIASGLSYRGVNIQKVQSEVLISLPGQVHLKNLKAFYTDGSAYVDIKMPGPKPGKIIEVKGNSTVSIRTLLAMISKDWDDVLPFLTFPPNSQTEFSSSILPDDPENSTFSAKIGLTQLKCWNLFLENLNSTLYLKDKHLVFDVKKTDFYGGKADVFYSHDFNENIRSLDIKTKKVSLPGILTRVSEKSLGKIAGDMDTHLKLKLIDPSEAGEDYELAGSGTVDIKDGNFFKVPLFSEFMGNLDTLLPLDATGRIQEVHGDLVFDKYKVKVSKFISDGSLLALSGKGEYDWQSENFDFIFNTHYLKSLLTLPKPFNFDVLSVIFSPVSTVMTGRLSGNFEKYKWELENLRKVKDFILNIPNALLNPIKKLFD